MAKEPVQCLLEDVKTFRADPLSYQKRAANPGLCDQPQDPDFIPSAWSTFAQRVVSLLRASDDESVSLSRASDPEAVRQMLRDALREVEFLPQSTERAKCAESLARSAELLEEKDQIWFFRAAVRLITDSKPEVSRHRVEVSSLLCGCAVSLKSLHKEAVLAGGELLLVEGGRGSTVAEEVYRSYSEIVGLPVKTIQEWDESHRLYQELIGMMKDGRW